MSKALSSHAIRERIAEIEQSIGPLLEERKILGRLLDLRSGNVTSSNGVATTAAVSSASTARDSSEQPKTLKDGIITVLRNVAGTPLTTEQILSELAKIGITTKAQQPIKNIEWHLWKLNDEGAAIIHHLGPHKYVMPSGWAEESASQ